MFVNHENLLKRHMFPSTRSHLFFFNAFISPISVSIFFMPKVELFFLFLGESCQNFLYNIYVSWGTAFGLTYQLLLYFYFLFHSLLILSISFVLTLAGNSKVDCFFDCTHFWVNSSLFCYFDLFCSLFSSVA